MSVPTWVLAFAGTGFFLIGVGVTMIYLRERRTWRR